MKRIALLAAAAALAAAQQPKAQHTQYVLESLRVAGNRQIPTGRVAAASGLKIGRAVEKADFDAARARLLATGAFENAGYEYKPAPDGKGYDAVLEVLEINELFPYRFEDLPASEDSLRGAIRQAEPIFEDRIPATAAVLERFAKALELFLSANGAEGVAVSGKLNGENPRLAVLFRPSSPRANIAEVRFVGNQAIPTASLLRAINAVAIGIPYTEAALRERLDASIRRLYETRGLIRVSFPAIAIEKAKTSEGVLVTVTVSEGQAYNLGLVQFTGAPAGESTQIEKLSNFNKGAVANFDEINATLQRILKRLRNSGYLRAASTVNRDIRDENHTVDLIVALEPGPRYVFGKLEIKGLDILSEPEIRKMWGALEGKPFNPEFPDSFLARVRSEGILDNLGKTSSETHIDEASKKVDVTLTFSAPPPARKETVRW
jgi:outer membrane protein insertion porin family